MGARSYDGAELSWVLDWMINRSHDVRRKQHHDTVREIELIRARDGDCLANTGWFAVCEVG